MKPTFLIKNPTRKSASCLGPQFESEALSWNPTWLPIPFLKPCLRLQPYFGTLTLFEIRIHTWNPTNHDLPMRLPPSTNHEGLIRWRHDVNALSVNFWVGKTKHLFFFRRLNFCHFSKLFVFSRAHMDQSARSGRGHVSALACFPNHVAREVAVAVVTPLGGCLGNPASRSLLRTEAQVSPRSRSRVRQLTLWEKLFEECMWVRMCWLLDVCNRASKKLGNTYCTHYNYTKSVINTWRVL